MTRWINNPTPPDKRFVLDPFEPAYLALDRAGEMSKRVTKALKELEECNACPRRCGVNRTEGETQVCNKGRHARVASVSPHFGEEDCLRGWNGSGTIFIACCNLQCVFCQNWDISQRSTGTECTAAQMAEIMIELQNRGCHNINFVTPEHVVPQVIEAVAEAIPKGLSTPIVYNTSAYDSLESLNLLDGIVDIYMPDFKFWDRDTAKQYVKAKDYPNRAREAILEMHRQVGPLRFSPEGVARRGVLLRHLVMPGLLHESKAIFEWLANEVSPDTFVNVMAQYRPANKVGSKGKNDEIRYTAINRRPEHEEIAQAHRLAREAGLWRFD
ncbi:MAG: radical SAM protein [Candidatus Latescibacterota bacterium]|nr:MAG: radical SAM protein [Candidatus Latescibacterota bacterium]